MDSSSVREGRLISKDTSSSNGTLSTEKKYLPSESKNNSDTTKVITMDTLKVDSVRIRFMSGMGKMTDAFDTTNVLHQNRFLWTDTKYFGELIWKIPGLFYRDIGETGKWGELYALGADGRSIGVLLDGRPMNDPVNGTYNLFDLPLEFVDHTEVFSGSSSLISSGSTGTSFNFISRSYNSVRPMTKIRYVQDPNGALLTDGLFTQNVARGLNLTVGFTRQVSQGNYPQVDDFKNISPSLNAWTIRTRLRYNLSNRLNLSFSDLYTKAVNGFTGGVIPINSSDVFSEATASNRFQHDSRSRHDLTLSAIARILPDTLSITQVTFYYSTVEREYWNPPDFKYFTFQDINDSTVASFHGFRLQQSLLLHPLSIIVGAQLDRRQTDSTRNLPKYFESEQAVFGQAEFRISDIFIPTIRLRFNSLDNAHSLNSGFGATSKLLNWLTLRGDISWFYRYPTILEKNWKDSTFLRIGNISKEQHSLIQGGVSVCFEEEFQFNISMFQRTIKNAILFFPSTTIYGSPAISLGNISKTNSTGIIGSLSARWNHFEFYGIATYNQYTQVDTAKSLIPDLLLVADISYRNLLFNDKLDAKFGIRTKFFDRQMGMQFDPQTLTYYENTTSILGRSTTLDLFTIIRIGDAYLSISWNNILGAKYILTPIYPMPRNQVRLGVNWVFVD